MFQDLLSNGQEFVFTARFQSDPNERRSAQYRRVSGGRFSISAKDINISEKTLMINAIINEGVEIHSTVLSTGEDSAWVAMLMEKVEKLVGEANSLQHNDDSRQVSYSVAG